MTRYLRGPWKSAASLFCGSFTAAITFALFWASLRFVLASHEGGEVLYYNLPVWVVLLVLPVGFGLITFRMVTDASESLMGRLLALILAGIIVAIVVVSPLIIPMGREFGIDPVHLGIIFVANLEVGFLTPPVGMNLFLSSYRFNKPMSEVIRSVWPMLAILLAGVIIITYVPDVTLLVVHLLQ